MLWEENVPPIEVDFHGLCNGGNLAELLHANQVSHRKSCKLLFSSSKLALVNERKSKVDLQSDNNAPDTRRQFGKIIWWGSSALTDRSSHQVFCVKRCFNKFQKIRRENLCQSCRPATLLKKRPWHRCFSVNFVNCNFIKKESLAQVFSCEFCQISKNNFFTEHPRTTAPVWIPFLLVLLMFD